MRLAHMVLICMVVLAVVSSVGFALSAPSIVRVGHRALGDPINDPRPNSPGPSYRVFGDPIDDPKPNLM